MPKPNEIDLARHLPDYRADAAIPGLAHPLQIHRDEWSIPHIRAQNRNDAFAGLGFAHAQDRLFQMEALLRRGTGRYAEWLGTRALPGDILARQLNTEGASKRDFAALGSEAREMLEAYARGVNAFIAQKRFPVEYAILETTPAAWEPWHSIAAMRQIGFLMGSVWWKLWRAAALPILGPERVAALRFDDGGDDFLCMPTGAITKRLVAALADLKPGVEALLGARDNVGAELEGGSNNWALSPQRTATGRPIVAGDPHRQLEMPNMYAQAHLCCDEFDVIGLTVPGVPGFPHFGHNADVAWGVTHAFVDIHDLYVERFAKDGTTYRFKDRMLPATRRTERILARDAEPTEITVVETHHGPIIAGDPADGTALALRSTQFAVEDHSFDCLIRMMRAKTVGELYETTRGWGLIDHNLVAGDTSGTIGHRVRALVPRRPRANGWLPVPGWTGEHEWNGMIPFEQMPCTLNPTDGLIVTANNRVVASDDNGPYLSTDSMPPHRARRILGRLHALKNPAPEDMPAIHRDRVSVPGVELREKLRTIMPPAGAENIHKTILAWDGEMQAASHGAMAYAVLRFELTRLVMERTGLQKAAASPYTKVAPGIVPENQFWTTVPQLLRANDTDLLAGETWDSLLAQALSAAATKLPNETWGALHTPKLKHQLSPAFPEHAAQLDRDCAALAGDNDTVFASGYASKAGWQATSSALSRYVFDVGNWDNCRWIVFHGVSGHVGSDAYLNQNATWAKGELVEMVYDWGKIEGMARQTLMPS